MSSKKKEMLYGYLFILPALISLGIFMIYPTIKTFYYSLTDFYMLKPQSINFVGLSNFKFLFSDYTITNAIKNTFYFVIISVPVQILLALLYAIFLNQMFIGRSIARTIIFSVSVIPGVAVANVWKMLVSSDGYINYFLKLLGFPPQPFLNSTSQAMNTIIAMVVWQAAAGQMMIFLAGLQDIPKSLYEAAEMDGANFLQKLIYVTIPGLRNIFNFILITSTIGALGIFTGPFIMTAGGPRGATETIFLKFYQIFVLQKDVGLGAALILVYFIIALILAIIQRKFVGEERQVVVEG
jgi:fructooligosaccharide transport system permease protein